MTSLSRLGFSSMFGGYIPIPILHILPIGNAPPLRLFRRIMAEMEVDESKELNEEKKDDGEKRIDT